MGESCPKLLDLIPKEREWGLNREGAEEGRRNGSSSDENKKLELRLGLPGDERWSQKNSSIRERNESLLSLNNYMPNNHNHPWPCSGYQTLQSQHQQQQNTASPFVHHHHHHSHNHNHQYQTGPKPQVLPLVTKESSHPCCTRIVDLQNAEKKAFSPASANTAVPNTSQKRAAPAPVVGWPPIRSFRKNLASSSSGKPVSEPQDPVPTKPVNEKPVTENSHKGQFVKINMDGVPIGRKVDLNAYDSYEKLSSAVDKLFRGLLAAQRDSPAGGIDIENNQEEQKPITGLLDGSGEYTLVYEDNEGDRMLVGDVPWHMFVSTVKRLRVLKSSDLPTLGCGGGSKEGKVRVESASK